MTFTAEVEELVTSAERALADPTPADVRGATPDQVATATVRRIFRLFTSLTPSERALAEAWTIGQARRVAMNPATSDLFRADYMDGMVV